MRVEPSRRVGVSAVSHYEFVQRIKCCLMVHYLADEALNMAEGFRGLDMELSVMLSLPLSALMSFVQSFKRCGMWIEARVMCSHFAAARSGLIASLAVCEPGEEASSTSFLLAKSRRDLV